MFKHSKYVLQDHFWAFYLFYSVQNIIPFCTHTFSWDATRSLLKEASIPELSLLWDTLRLNRLRPRELVGVTVGVPFDVLGVAGGMMPPALLVDRRGREDLGVVGDGVTPSRLLPDLWIGVQGGNSFSKGTLLRGVLVFTCELLIFIRFAGGDGDITQLAPRSSSSSSIINDSGDGALDFLIADFAGAFGGTRDEDFEDEVIRLFLFGVSPPSSESESIMVTSSKVTDFWSFIFVNFGDLSLDWSVSSLDLSPLDWSLFSVFINSQVFNVFCSAFIVSYNFFPRHQLQTSLNEGGGATGVITME